jgi:hypothetical protein
MSNLNIIHIINRRTEKAAHQTRHLPSRILNSYGAIPFLPMSDPVLALATTLSAQPYLIPAGARLL